MHKSLQGHTCVFLFDLYSLTLSPFCGFLFSFWGAKRPPLQAHTIEQLDSLVADPNTSSYIINTFGSAERLKMLILSDYFKHGFDGTEFEFC